ncbi:MAG: DUF192 domain-containing protein [Candidatus Paracaedibacteraceae bacterium]|nr:DUF192 domain-containing protein [Candidatus Paracaedibacteraceae bacterium]
MNNAFKNILSLASVLCLGFAILRMPSEVVCFDMKENHICLRVLRAHEDQLRGFQLVEHIRPSEGLLYILGHEKKPNFWMKDVLQNLDIIFVDKDGCIVEMIQAKSHRKDVIVPPSETMYAIELLEGTASKLNLSKGGKIGADIFPDFEGMLLIGKCN